MKNLLAIAFLAICVPCAFGQNTKLSPNDLRPVAGPLWTGSLTYVDYSSGKRTSIKSNLAVSKIGDRKWSFDFQYPDEPKANSKDDVVLSEDGRTFDGESVIGRARLKGGMTRIVTSRDGTDNNKPATIRHTYLISTTEFSIRKDVRVNGSSEYFERNTYSWRR